MENDPHEQTLEELRREARLLRAWLRDIRSPKHARLRQITAEINRRTRKDHTPQ